MESVASAKEAVRALVKARIAALSPQQRDLESSHVCSLLLALPSVQTAKRVALYSHLSNREVDVSRAARELEQQGKTILLPRIGPDRRMAFVRATKNNVTSLFPHPKFGFLQPDESAEEEAPDVVVCPGRAFDERGFRVGWGKGFYDTALAALSAPCTTIGVCFACQVDCFSSSSQSAHVSSQVFATVPCEPHDRPMDVVLYKVAV